MTNIIAFPLQRRVEIYHGRWVRLMNDRTGPTAFFVEAVEPDSRVCLWAGSSYDEAIQQARDLGGEFGPVLDLVIEA